jgi:predicted GIY-YIG superfamily endonuclease
VRLKMPEQKRFVYVLKSGEFQAHFYVGLTSDVRARLSDHHDGRCPRTA